MQWNMSNAVFAGILAALILFLLAWLLWRKLERNAELKYEFVTIITHKFRTPLAGAKWLLDDLVKTEQDPLRRDNLAKVQKSNGELIKLLSSMVAMTEAASSAKVLYQLERLDLCAFVKERVEAMRRDFQEKNIFIAAMCPEKPIYVKADRSRLEFVLDALLENARMYTPTGLKVSVAVFHSWGRARVAVADEGIGIGRLALLHVFDPFYRTPEATAMDTEGLGISLYLARSIARRHKGDIRASSRGAKKGSSFTLLLPRAR